MKQRQERRAVERDGGRKHKGDSTNARRRKEEEKERSSKRGNDKGCNEQAQEARLPSTNRSGFSDRG